MKACIGVDRIEDLWIYPAFGENENVEKKFMNNDWVLNNVINLLYNKSLNKL